MTEEMRAICVGVHVLDVLVRPVEAIPEGQGGELVDEIRITAAGSASGTALVLAKLGARVKSSGAIGRDAAGDMLLALLERDGVDTELLVRRDDVQTSASVLPIRPHGAVTSADVLAPGEPGLLEWIAPALSELDYLLPNREQVLALTGADELEEGCRALLERGVGCVAVTCGAEGVALVDAQGAEMVPAFQVEAIDTTGCGDAFSAGFLRGLALGRERRDAAVLGCAAAALVAQGLGTDHGDFDLAEVEQMAA
jgi:sugar/nucleoside kinase (ribokinase family)